VASAQKENDAPDFAAVKAFAMHVIGDTAEGWQEMEELLQSAPGNATVQVLGGTLLQAAGKSDEALAVLSKHQGSLEAIALIVHIHLQQNRTDLALKEVQAARRWAQDSLLVNIAESWVGLRVGGEKYQQAFYVFEELAQAPSTSSSKSLVGQAVAELHLGRFSEAEAALQEAVRRDPQDAEAVANSIVLNVILGKNTAELESSLKEITPDHPFLLDLGEKEALFDQASTKYSAKVAG
jgi:coatomer protein complex subunit epsilon